MNHRGQGDGRQMWQAGQTLTALSVLARVPEMLGGPILTGRLKQKERWSARSLRRLETGNGRRDGDQCHFQGKLGNVQRLPFWRFSRDAHCRPVEIGQIRSCRTPEQRRHFLPQSLRPGRCIQQPRRRRKSPIRFPTSPIKRRHPSRRRHNQPIAQTILAIRSTVRPNCLWSNWWRRFKPGIRRSRRPVRRGEPPPRDIRRRFRSTIRCSRT